MQRWRLFAMKSYFEPRVHCGQETLSCRQVFGRGPFEENRSWAIFAQQSLFTRFLGATASSLTAKNNLPVCSVPNSNIRSNSPCTQTLAVV